MNLATYITLSRILLIIPVIWFMSFDQIAYNIIALLLFLLAGITDYLDGYIARKTNTQSRLGALLDLLADKLLVCIVLIWLITLDNSIYVVIPVLIIIFRELSISYIRQFIAENKVSNKLEVSFFGKSKTTIQFIAISLMIISPSLGIYFLQFSIAMLWVASIISLLSFLDYILSWKGNI